MTTESEVYDAIRAHGDIGVTAKALRKELGMRLKDTSTMLAGLETKHRVNAHQDGSEWYWHTVEEPTPEPAPAKRGRGRPRKAPEAPVDPSAPAEPQPIDTTVPPGSELPCDKCVNGPADRCDPSSCKYHGWSGYDPKEPTNNNAQMNLSKMAEELAALPDCDGPECLIGGKSPSSAVPVARVVPGPTSVTHRDPGNAPIGTDLGAMFKTKEEMAAASPLVSEALGIIKQIGSEDLPTTVTPEDRRAWLLSAVQRFSDEAEAIGFRVEVSVEWPKLRGAVVATEQGVRA